MSDRQNHPSPKRRHPLPYGRLVSTTLGNVAAVTRDSGEPLGARLACADPMRAAAPMSE